MLPGGVEGPKAKAAESDNGFTSDSLSKDFEFWNKSDGTSCVLREHNQVKNFKAIMILWVRHTVVAFSSSLSESKKLPKWCNRSEHLKCFKFYKQ